MTDNNQSARSEEALLRQRLRETQDSAGAEPSPQHDAAILDAARATGGNIRQRADTRSRAPTVQLTVPSEVAVRGSSGTGAGSPVRVEQVDPAAWYRYIQELAFSGQTELAEVHLRRFLELHPDFVFQP